MSGMFHVNLHIEVAIKPALPLRKQVFAAQIAWFVDFLIVVGILGLHRVGGQEDRRLWRAVDVII